MDGRKLRMQGDASIVGLGLGTGLALGPPIGGSIGCWEKQK